MLYNYENRNMYFVDVSKGEKYLNEALSIAYEWLINKPKDGFVDMKEEDFYQLQQGLIIILGDTNNDYKKSRVDAGNLLLKTSKFLPLREQVLNDMLEDKSDSIRILAIDNLDLSTDDGQKKFLRIYMDEDESVVVKAKTEEIHDRHMTNVCIDATMDDLTTNFDLAF